MNLRDCGLVVFCLVNPVILISGLIGGQYVPRDSLLESVFLGFFGVGMLVVLGHLWSREGTQDDKIWWSVLIFLMVPVFLPIYWFRFVRRAGGGLTF